ncbi:MAG: response regulator transcription factor [Schlesneria sp.]
MTTDSIDEQFTAQNPCPARILVVDDHPIIREGLSALLVAKPDMVVCGEASSISGALKIVTELGPDVAVVDIALNGENGLDLVRRMKVITPQLRVLVVSMYDDELYAERALEAGAMGYLNKQVASRNIVEAIRRLLAGKQYLSDETAARIAASKNEHLPDGARRGLSALTNREMEVFKQIGSGMTTAEIAGALYLSVKTVDSHRQKIKMKLDLNTSAELSREAVRFVMGNG